MAHTYMVQTVEQFFSQLDGMGTELQRFAENTEERRRQILEALKNFEQKADELKNLVAKGQTHSDQVQRAAAQAVTGIDAIIQEWRRDMETSTKGAQFMKKHEKFLVVLVFGAVKAGKSSLANFIKGDSFRDAAFDNGYKQHPEPDVKTEESGRNSGGIETDAKGRKRFAVGYVDTTGAIQYFTLQGLRWMDTPGTGAVHKKEDSKDMDAMVEQYLSYADYCLFLINSAEPGLMDDFKYIGKLKKAGQEALILLTKSDVNETDIDDDGQIITRLTAKNAENRSLQEGYMKEQLQKKYPALDASKYRVFSISTGLAEEAVKTDNDALFKDSHLDMLLHALGDKFSNEAGPLKKNRSKQAVNAFIDGLTASINGENGKGKIRELLHSITEKNKEYLDNLEKKKGRICRTITGSIRTDVNRQAAEWDEGVERTGKAIAPETAERSIQRIVNQHISQELEREIGGVIESFAMQNVRAFQASLQVGSIGKKSKTIEQKIKKVYVTERDPDGIGEHIRHFFGKKYYRRYTYEETLPIHIDLGSNIQDYLDKLLPLLETSVKQYVEQEISRVEKEYFAPQQQYAENMAVALDQLQRDLEKAKFQSA